MRAFFGLAFAVGGTADDDFDLVFDPVVDETVQREGAWHAVDQCQHVGREVFLQRGVLIQVVQHNLWHSVALEHNNQTLTGSSGGFVTHIGDARQFALVDQFGDASRQVVRVGHVRQFGDDQCGAVLHFFDVDDGAHGDRATAGAVGLFNTCVAEDLGAGWEVWALDALDGGFEQFFPGGFWVIQVPLHAFGDFAQVVRWDLGGHPHGNTG